MINRCYYPLHLTVSKTAAAEKASFSGIARRFLPSLPDMVNPLGYYSSSDDEQQSYTPYGSFGEENDRFFDENDPRDPRRHQVDPDRNSVDSAAVLSDEEPPASSTGPPTVIICTAPQFLPLLPKRKASKAKKVGKVLWKHVEEQARSCQTARNCRICLQILTRRESSIVQSGKMSSFKHVLRDAQKLKRCPFTSRMMPLWQ